MSWRDYRDKKKEISEEEKKNRENVDLNQKVASNNRTINNSNGALHIKRTSPYNYGRGNIDLNNRPVVQNDDGSISTVRSMSFYDENEGKEILVPTVVNGKIVSDSEARQHYYDTGEYLGKFDTVKEANSYAKRVHDQQERLYGQPKTMWDRVNEKAEWLSQQNAYDIYGNLFKGISNKADDLLYSDEVNEKYAKVQEEKQARQQARSESAKSKGLLAQARAGATNLVENIFQKPKAFYDNDKLGVKDIFDIPKTAISTTINAGSHAIGAISDFGKSATNIFGAGMITASSAMGNEEDSQKWKNALREENESYQNFKEGLTSLGASDSALGKTGGQAVESITSSMAYGLDKVGGALLLGSGLGSSLEESYSRDDVENWQAWAKGFGDMAIGYYAEQINDSFGFGGNGLSNTVKNAVMNKMKSGTAKFLTRLGLSGLFEASEEIIEPVAKNLIFNRALNFVTDLVGHGAKFDTNIDVEDMTSSSLLAFFQGTVGAKNQSTANINEKEIVKNMVDNLKEQGYEVTPKDKKLFKQIALTAKENAIAEDYKYASRDEAIQNSKLSDEQKSELLESVRKEDTKPKELKEKIKETEKANKEIEKKIETSNLPQAQKEGLTQLLHQNTNTAEMDSAVDYAIEEDRKVNARVNEQINAIDEGKTTVDKLINDNAILTDAQKQDLLTRLNNGEIDDYTALTEVVDLEEGNQQKVDIINNMNYNINQKSNASIQNVTVAPYYDTPVTDENFEEIKNQVEADFTNKANTITNLIGGKIKNINTNIGGYEYQTGEKAGDVVNELSYTFELEDVDEEQANLFASLMGDLGYEKQETVIRSTYAEEGKGNSVETTINLNSIDGVKEILDKLGIKNYTIDTSNKQLKIYSDDLSNEIKILVADLAEELGGNFNGAEWNETDSEFLGEELRRGIYEAWLKNHQGEQEGELYKNISEAYRKLTREEVNNNFKDISIGEIKKVPVKSLLPLLNDGGYRTDEELNNLKTDIKENGITTPIELVRKNNGKIEIEDGNHRLQIANELGLKEVPITFVENWENIGITSDFSEKEMIEDVGGIYDTQNGINNKNNNINEKNRNLEGSSRNSSNKFENRGATTNNVKLLEKQPNDNKQTNIIKTERNNRKVEDSQNESSLLIEEKTDEEVLREETNKLLNNELPKTKPRQFPISTQESEYISEETKRENSRKILKTETGQYIPIGNQETIDKANSVIQTSGADKVYDSFNKKFENNEKMTLDDIAEAELLIQHYSDIGDNKKAIKLIEEVGILGTELGQQVQALSIIKKMTPQGQLAVAKKLADRLSQKYDTDITLSDEVQKEILNSDMENIEDAIDKAYTEIADQLPLTIKERLDNLRFLAMLGNPKTHIRNMVGNVGNRALTNIKNTVKGGIEDLVGMAWKDYQKNATLGIATKDQRTFAKLDAEKLGEAIDNIGNKYSDKPESIISKKKRHFDNKILNGLSKFNTEQLNKEDTKALKGAYRDALQNYMLANNLSSEDLTVLESDSREVVKQKEEALRKAREYASQQAKEATFHQANELATWLNNLKDSKSLPRKNCRAFSRRYSTI